MSDQDSPDSQDNAAIPEPGPRPWIVLQTTYDVEAWIDSYNRDLQAVVWKRGKANPVGQGICFALELGGEIYLHTTSEGNVLLDVSEEASWVTPVISAASGVAPPAGSVWLMADDKLTQLVLGLSGMIATTRIVLEHDFKLRKNGYLR
ncbi:hypothetical protein PQR62_02915 [Herbaspirillum lusitanum]|uniref:SCP2 domain-containing protein n=1 Tax=Herbaspirillum lusitanum TaxID=213312 RepID=A0ABW9A2Z2_9BURK